MSQMAFPRRPICRGLFGFSGNRLIGEMRAIQPIIWALLGLGFAVRLATVHYGLPQLLDPDEQIFVGVAGGMLRDMTLDPGWYGAPASTLILALTLFYGIFGVVGLVTGQFSSPADISALYYGDPTVFFLIGRVTTVVVGMLCLLAAMAIMRRLASVSGVVVATAVLALSPLMVHYSSVIRMDMYQILFMLLTVHFSLLIAESGRLRSFIFAGVCLGLAVASKYPGVIAAIAIVGAAVCYLRSVIDSEFHVWKGLVAAAAASVVSAFLVGPFLFLNFGEVIKDVLLEARSRHLSATSSGFISAIWTYLTEFIPTAMGWPATLVGIGGLVILATRGKWSIVPLLFAAYLLFMSALSLIWLRWALPLLPLVAIGVAVGVDEISSAFIRLARRLAGRLHALPVSRAVKMAITMATGVLLVVPPAAETLEKSRARLFNDDTRVLAKRWIDNNLPSNASILLETYAPQLSRDNYDVLVISGGEIRRWADVSKHRRPRPFGSENLGIGNVAPLKRLRMIEMASPDYIVISNWYDRAADESERYPNIYGFYKELLGRANLIKEFSPSSRTLGPKIRILELGPR